MSDPQEAVLPAGKGAPSDAAGKRRDASMLYVTCASVNEARTIARVLLGERLVACANILGAMRSIYRWQDEIVEDDETAMLLKTPDGRVDAVVARVRELHSYDVPCVVEVPLARGNTAFFDWIAAEAAGGPE